MILLEGLKEVEVRPEQACDGVLARPNNRQPAASFRPAWSETGNQHEAARLDGLAQSIRVGSAILRIRQEMQDCSIMP